MNYLDIIYVLKWFLVFFIIGTAFLPLTFYIFFNFKDKGYIFSKIISVAIISYTVFVLGTIHILKFNFYSIFLILFFYFCINYYLSRIKKINIISIIKKNIKVFFVEELIFFSCLIFWIFVRSNLPEIHGLEKFMDFGFLNSILRSEYFPPKDMWYTPLSINYYYFGHLITAVLTKLSYIPSFISYNLMISTLFALTFSASFSLGINIFNNEKFSLKSNISGFITAIFVSFGGNLTTLYTFFKPYVPADKPVPFWQLPFLPFNFPNDYWYPNATRFIPFTIHEFPLYSFVVSDLHGHVLDIPFVLLIIAVLFSLFLKTDLKIKNLKLEITLISFLLAIMYMTNAWDGFIYLLLTLMLFAFFYLYKNGIKLFLSSVNLYELLKNFLTIILGFIVFSLPFSLNFKPFVSGIGILCAPSFLTNLGKMGPFLFETNHCQKSPIWQLLILYGFFYFFVISFIIFLKLKKKYNLSKNDIFVLILIILSSLLLIIPEFIYIKDIYPMHYRANTMFKLSYEAFIMLSICCAYILAKLLSNIKNKIFLGIFFVISIFLISLNLIYPFFAIGSYYKNLTNYQNLNGIKYLSISYPDDYNLINWMNKNIKDQPVILEASGDSYTDYARISANTGLPTIIGWSVHEWLWRGTYDIVAPRIADVQQIYESNIFSDEEEFYIVKPGDYLIKIAEEIKFGDWKNIYNMNKDLIKNPSLIFPNQKFIIRKKSSEKINNEKLDTVKNLIKKYKITYIIVSSLEKEKYPNLNEDNFKKLGRIVYQSNTTKLYRINLGEF